MNGWRITHHQVTLKTRSLTSSFICVTPTESKRSASEQRREWLESPESVRHRQHEAVAQSQRGALTDVLNGELPDETTGSLGGREGDYTLSCYFKWMLCGHFSFFLRCESCMQNCEFLDRLFLKGADVRFFARNGCVSAWPNRLY